MNYLIRDGQSYPVPYPADFYRGTDRKEPVLFDDALPEDQEISQLFAWYLEEMESGFIHDLAKAHRYAELCNQRLPGKRFEVIEVTDGETAPADVAQLLGFDISFGGAGDSLIFLVLLAGPSESIPDEPVNLLSDLIRRYFCPKLNDFGLFRTFEDASHCRRAMIALQSFHPNFYEGGDLEIFTVTGVYLMPQPDNGAT
jgi:hypothetical protein